MNSETMRPLRICMLDQAAMIPYYTGHLCAALRGQQAAVSLASVTYQHDPEFFRQAGIRNHPGLVDLTYRLRRAPEQIRRMFKVLEYLVNLAALMLRVTVSRPDVLHVQFLPLSTRGVPIERWFLRAAKFRGILIVYTVHNVLPQDTGERYRSTYRHLYHLPDHLVCHDVQAASRLTAEFGIDPGRISIIPHGPLFEDTDASPREVARTRLGFPRDEPLVLWQGILRPYKGVEFLLRVWKRFCEVSSRGQLVIAGLGDRALMRDIEAGAEALGIRPRVRLELRFLTIREVADWYDAADILVYPYREITTSGALLTGVARRRAIIASRLPAFEQLLHDGINALLIPYGDVEGWAYALLRLVGDPELRQSLTSCLRASQASFPRWADIASRTCDCYRDALREQPAGAHQPVRI